MRIDNSISEPSAHILRQLAEATTTDLRVLARGLNKLAKKQLWRHCAARRADVVHQGLKKLRSLLGDRYFRREKRDGAWVFYARRPDLVIVPVFLFGNTIAKSWSDVLSPMQVAVLRDDLFDTAKLVAWQESRILVEVVWPDWDDSDEEWNES